jgi:hypothetical protein
MMTVEDKIIELLRENTGKVMCDSGGSPTYINGEYTGSTQGFGRNFEKNTNRDFKNEPILTVIPDDLYKYALPDITLSLYHYLTSFLNITSESVQIQTEFEKFDSLNMDNSPMNNMDDFLSDERFTEWYCASKQIVNTVNYDSMLSQIIQYILFVYKDEEYIMLQIHNGADVRSGYTFPYTFAVNSPDSFLLADSNLYADEIYPIKDTLQLELFEIEDSLEPNRWYSDDYGYHWWSDCTEIPALKDVIEYSEEKNIFFNNRTGNEINFYPGIYN